MNRRNFLKVGGAALLATAMGRPFILDSVDAQAPVVYRGSAFYPRIAMTYDDCFHPEVLEQLMALVRPYPEFHFTFFAVGEALEINESVSPGIWKRLQKAGHELGYHTYHHVDPIVMSTKALVADFDQWSLKLAEVLGVESRVHFARPPGNDLSLSFQELCAERGLVATQFSTGLEAPNLDESMRLASRIVNGDIVQMHTYQDPPNGRFDVDISAKVVPYLVQRGYALVTMSQLYDDLVREQTDSKGCNIGAGTALTRTCLD
jgi:peptidoglycan/xylan/chitin deacetylase (PgdA/CDA1 family)